jgi:hypothetical protein
MFFTIKYVDISFSVPDRERPWILKTSVMTRKIGAHSELLIVIIDGYI